MTTDTICSLTEDMLSTQRLEFIRALESGAYKQCYYHLFMSSSGSFSYCALGVACIVLNALIVEQINYKDKRFQLNYDDYSFIVELNDENRLTFTEIAKELRKRWELNDPTILPSD